MKRKTMGWLIVFLLFIVYMLNYMDRSALSITAPLIEKELGFNAAEMGMIFSAFFIGYALFNFIGGWASDKVGPKTVFLIAALLWSVFCGLTGLVTGLWTMLIVRVLFGMAEGPVSAAGNKIINNWISRKESATAIGIFSAGSPLGGAVSGPVVGLLALSLGWRPAFGIIFLFGLVWVLLTGPIYWAVIQDVVHKDKVGSVGGAMHGLANISGIIGPLVTGFIVQFSGKYDYAFYLAGAIAIVSSLLVFVFVKSKGFKANESQSCVH
ncbi:MFS transporter [Salmonella enterica]|nr:MFS transporter [Salmonella enterica]